MTIPQCDAVPQYDVEADNYDAKRRRVSSAMAVSDTLIDFKIHVCLTAICDTLIDF
jgi:hypothetical protein